LQQRRGERVLDDVGSGSRTMHIRLCLNEMRSGKTAVVTLAKAGR
jgi:hypothetical protein